ncbi:hypothetical protein COE50_06235 [Bacillus anthracis]|nr:hypothetical protein COE50_06235 [Bacillus anthracis]
MLKLNRVFLGNDYPVVGLGFSIVGMLFFIISCRVQIFTALWLGSIGISSISNCAALKVFVGYIEKRES